MTALFYSCYELRDSLCRSGFSREFLKATSHSTITVDILYVGAALAANVSGQRVVSSKW